MHDKLSRLQYYVACAVANDYETFETFSSDVRGWLAETGENTMDDAILETLELLIKEGLVRAYKSPGAPTEFSRGQSQELWYKATPAGITRANQEDDWCADGSIGPAETAHRRTLRLRRLKCELIMAASEDFETFTVLSSRVRRQLADINANATDDEISDVLKELVSSGFLHERQGFYLISADQDRMKLFLFKATPAGLELAKSLGKTTADD